MFKAFQQLPQSFIMRYSGNIDDVKQFTPANVHLKKWIPQNDLLGHKNTKAFITHAGNNGRYEGVYHAVPMVAMPLF
jgi:UDP:flavonoid glycosyltransferase YjiC (YdhE family)